MVLLPQVLVVVLLLVILVLVVVLLFLLVVAVLVCGFNTALDGAVLGVVFEKLVQLLGHDELHSIAAAELIAKGYARWRKHLPDTTKLMKLLFDLSIELKGREGLAGHQRASLARRPVLDSAAAEDGSLTITNRYLSALITVGLADPRVFCHAMGQ